MSNFKGFVLQGELTQKANVSNCLFKQLVNVKTKKMGCLVCVLKDSLPLKYKQIADECIDLERYWTYSYINKILGLSTHYMSVTERQQPIIFKTFNRIKLFELSNEFIEKINEGLNPFKIKDKSDEELAKEIVVMQGLKIGFY